MLYGPVRQKNANGGKAMDDTKVIEAWLAGNRIGRLALTEDGLCAFEYDTEFLKNGFSISPFYLPLRQELFIARSEPFRGGFGVFDDSLPDGWGNLILDRYLREKGIDPDRLTILQRLALVGNAGRGALEYRPDKSAAGGEDFIDFDKLAAESKKILTSNYTGDSLDTLYKYGGSSGGARPKVFVRIEDREWLVKFKATVDLADVGRIEYEYSLLARQCGIHMPETRLFEDKYFGVERFDRTSGGKIHTVSAAGLLNANYRIPGLDYAVLLKVCLSLTRNMEEVYALFRLMVFNVCISNRDDHAKNFSFQFNNGIWRLSPAYDLLPSPGFNGFHTTTINGKGEPTKEDILKVAEEVGLPRQRALSIVDEVISVCNAESKLNYKF